ncbi:hypothetical protein DUNSADRAFT_10844 [Dunaliella salina]|uniref:Encoded protein n=1 Tax=Dunaliella salina TaxID=3046 RepID=A0ABQ7H9Z6_DUNSA|nr:hypothetical protein DUNSADRAFT_10844 [Dunaliella salina]|eukprot:KAF5843669.1 hypothetical protein DUNSADRAFT_10844 [Dunaliella salina]
MHGCSQKKDMNMDKVQASSSLKNPLQLKQRQPSARQAFCVFALAQEKSFDRDSAMNSLQSAIGFLWHLDQQFSKLGVTRALVATCQTPQPAGPVPVQHQQSSSKPSKRS